MNINAKNVDFKNLNEALRSAGAECEISSCLGQRFIASGLSDKKITINGIPGNALGAYLNGATIEVMGNAQDAVGDTMNDGEIIVALIKDAYPDYSKNNGRVLAKHFSHNVLKEILNELDIMQSMKSVSDTIYLPFWDKVMYYLLDWYESYIANIKNDLLRMITSESNRVGLDRLCVLSDDRIKFYEEKEWKTRFSDGLKIPDKSKLIFSNCENNETANVWKSIMICKTNELMYYDLILSLEYDLPIKICKNCNVPFIPSGRPDTLYCDRIMPGFKCKCSAIGSINTYWKNLPKIEEEFYSARKDTIPEPCAIQVSSLVLMHGKPWQKKKSTNTETV